MPRKPEQLPIYHSGKVHVMKRMCESCVFHPVAPIDLDEGRLEQVVQENLENGAGLPCHSTVYSLYGLGEQEAVCKGFFDRYASEIVALRAAKMMGIIAQVEPSESNSRQSEIST